MNDIKCPSCGKIVEISEAFKHQFEDSILAKSETKHKEEIEKLRSEIEVKAERKIKEELELKFKDSKDELEEALGQLMKAGDVFRPKKGFVQRM